MAAIEPTLSGGLICNARSHALFTVLQQSRGQHGEKLTARKEVQVHTD
jgi:hypothetical protein